MYREIVQPERLVYTESYDPYPDAESLVTTTFEEKDGKTILTCTALYPSRDVRDMVIQSGMESGAAETWDRLDEYAATLGR